MSYELRSRDLQRLLASARYYSGAIDGIEGANTIRGVDIVGGNRGGWEPGWNYARQRVAAAQIILSAQGYEPGIVDGWWGHNSEEALTAWLSAQSGADSSVPRVPLPGAPMGGLPRQSECPSFYGRPGTAEIEARMSYVVPPFRMRLDYALDTPASRLRVHELCAPALTLALEDILAEYGEKEIRRLGLDRYAGGYNPRRMRGGSAWSMHSYGCAIDIFAAPNALRMKCPEALFCGAEYEPFLDIMEARGWLPAIRLWGSDAMHFQMARLG